MHVLSVHRAPVHRKNEFDNSLWSFKGELWLLLNAWKKEEHLLAFWDRTWQMIYDLIDFFAIVFTFEKLALIEQACHTQDDLVFERLWGIHSLRADVLLTVVGVVQHYQNNWLISWED